MEAVVTRELITSFLDESREPQPTRDAMKKPDKATNDSAEIDANIQKLGGWRGEMLGKLRQLIKDADPDVVEEIKWRKVANPDGVPVWSHDGMICTGEAYKSAVKLTFPNGAKLK